MANFAVTDREALDSLNYILSGPIPTVNQFKYKNFQEFQYCTGNRIAPYMSKILPSPPPPVDQYIETDCYNIVNIADPTQKVLISSQVRPFFSASCTQPNSQINIYVALNRYKAPSILFFPKELTYYQFNFTSSSNIVDEDLGRLIFLNWVDEPNEIGTFYYWLEFYAETAGLNGDFTLDYIGAELRGISTSVFTTAAEVKDV